MNRRMDAIYFGLRLAVFAFAYVLANRPTDRPREEVEGVGPLVLEAPAVDLGIELDFEFPYDYARLQRPAPPKLRLSENMESILVEVRSALLESARPIAAQPSEELAAVLE